MILIFANQDRLWKHTYPDYYMYEYNHTIESPEDWHEHAGEFKTNTPN